MTQSAALITIESISTLPALIDRAVNALAGARSAAEVLEARELAGVAYDIAKRTARLAKAKQAHDDVIAAALRAQGDAMKIQSEAAHRLADEYDAAQERGEVATKGKPVNVPDENIKATLPDIGLSRKDIHEARIIRDAENAAPGIVQRTVDEAIANGEEPSKAKVRRAALRIVRDAEPQSRPPTRGKEAICIRVREAVALLSGLPPAFEVVGYFAGNDSAIVINEHIAQAAAWLDQFRAAWGDASNADD